jgi:hypothetical protein
MKKILYILLLCFMSLPAFSQSIELKLDEHRVEFPSNKGGEVSGRIYNKTTDQIKIVFNRWQTLPKDWTSTVCLDVCYADFVDSLPWGTIEHSVIEPGSFVPFIIHFYPSGNTNDSGVVYTKLSVVQSSEDDTIGVWVVGKSNVVESVKKSDIAGQISITAHPNPSLVSSTFTFSLSTPSSVSLVLYDMMGREKATVISNEHHERGVYTKDFATSSLPAGSYIYRLSTSEGVRTGTLNIIK